MATIYQIPTGSKCLHLDIREALVFPFDFGTGWKELQLGIFFNFVSTSGDNLPSTPETLNSSNLKDRFAIGFTSRNNPAPLTQGGMFFGITTTGIGSDSVALNSLSPNADERILYMNTNNIPIVLTENTSAIKESLYYAGFGFGFSPTGTLQSGYCSYLGIKMGVENGYFSGNLSKEYPISNTNQIFLRQKMSQNPSAGTIITGFYRSNGEITGQVIAKPDAVMIYSPFYFNKLRIQNILVRVNR